MLKDREIEGKLANAIRETTPDILDDILDKCYKQKGLIPAMINAEINNVSVLQAKSSALQIGKSVLWKGLSAVAAAALLFAGGLTYMNNFAVDSIIGIDVNPSIQLKASRSQRVLDVKALNRDARIILADMDLKGVDLDVAVNAVIGSMLKNGYVDDLRNSILISVENTNEAKGAVLQDKLASEVNAILEASSVEGAVLSQTICQDDALKKLAAEYDISTGKAALIRNLLKQDSTLKFSDLTKLSITELGLLAENRKTELEDIKSIGAVANIYIGEAKARETALNHVGLKEAEVKFIRTALNYKTRQVVYDVEFYKGYTEYDFEIDAKTGVIAKYDNDVEDFEAAAADLISEAKAKEAALAHVILAETDVKIIRNQLTKENGAYVYHVEFWKDYTEYDFIIDAKTGSILSYDNDIEGFDATQHLLSDSQARQIALNHAGLKAEDATFTKAKLNFDEGKYLYDLEFTAGKVEYRYEIDARTGVVLKYEKDQSNDNPQPEVNAKDYISKAKAKEIAFKHAGISQADAKFTKVKLDYDNGRYVYDVEFVYGKAKYDYELEAKTGEILKYDKETWDKDQDDDRDDDCAGWNGGWQDDNWNNKDQDGKSPKDNNWNNKNQKDNGWNNKDQHDKNQKNDERNNKDQNNKTQKDNAWNNKNQNSKIQSVSAWNNTGKIKDACTGRKSGFGGNQITKS
ncbi:MAG: PepSY domain-containing protein [Peptococcaceae bacterium]|nr:PepSY domain-containing protein [Peptococcaceae bacterium]